MDEYIFRVEKRTAEHPLTPKLLVEFGCNAADPKVVIEAIVAFGELLKLYKTPENVAAFLKHNAGEQRAKLVF